MYRKRNVPAEVDPSGFFSEEFSRVEQGMQTAVPFVILSTQYKEPDKLIEGMDVLADGVLWNPGSGAGRYCYYAGSWKKLG